MADLAACKEIGYGPIPGADHKYPAYHYKLEPGGAYKRDPKTGEWSMAEVSKATADKAEYVYLLSWVQGRTVAEFHVGDDVYAQPTPTSAVVKPLKPKATKKDKSITAQVKESQTKEEAKEAQPLPAAPARPAPAERAPTPTKAKRPKPPKNFDTL